MLSVPLQKCADVNKFRRVPPTHKNMYLDAVGTTGEHQHKPIIAPVLIPLCIAYPAQDNVMQTHLARESRYSAEKRVQIQRHLINAVDITFLPVSIVCARGQYIDRIGHRTTGSAACSVVCDHGN